ncbi:MAG TPA: acetate--CoA ligase family protein, partial [bacterium]
MSHQEKPDLDPIFQPKSVAVIGASDREHTLNRAMFMNLILGNFQGAVYPVNPSHDYVHGIRAYKTIEDIPDHIDLAVILVPKKFVLDVLDQCGRKGVKGVVLITAGYKETGHDGAQEEKEIVEKIREYGMRMIGPNCFGVMNTDPKVQMNATFTAYEPTPGKVGFISQSGGLGEILIDRAQRVGLGMAQFASIGNKADVKGDEILDYWENDERIKAILLYLENIGNPRRFGTIAASISRVKPIITLKAGRTERGAKAASSHTGALADEDAANIAIFEQYGVIQVDSVETLFQTGSLLVNQPEIKGRNVLVVTNAGGPGILATDALITHGMQIPELCDNEIQRLETELRPECSIRNPIDVIASGGPEEYKKAIEAGMNDDNIHAIFVLFIPVIMVDAEEVARVIGEFSDMKKKPIQVVWLTRGRYRGEDAENYLREKLVPLYEMPLDAARALGLATSYYEWRRKPVGEFPEFDIDISKAKAITESVYQAGRTAFNDKEAIELFRFYGLPTLRSERIKTRDQALETAQDIGYPVVLKASVTGLLHKTEVGGVELDIKDPTELMDAFSRINANLKSHNYTEDVEFLVQPMMNLDEGGVECVLGLRNLEKYGPMIMFGMGGIYIEILKAVSFRMVPMTDMDAAEMVKTSPGWPILAGARGRKPID